MRLLPRLLKRGVRRGRLHLSGPGGYEADFGGHEPGPEVAVRITDPRLDWKIALNPDIAAAEAFMDGTLTVEAGPEGGRIADLLELGVLNRRHFLGAPSQRALVALRRAARRLILNNPVGRARRNVAHHYDLGNAFYRRWLDGDMQYSCGYFPTGNETLDEAQLLKKRHIAAKLRLRPGQRVLDIGCGWGGMALYLAAVADVEVHGVTLSREQIDIARARAEAAGLADRVRFELVDYRELDARYDRIVSVGMLEHVGVNHLTRYFAQVRDCLEPDGVVLIHSISSMAPPGVTNAFLRKYIFPGAYAPPLSELTRALERAGVWGLDVEVWRLHYARTLRAWRGRFEACRDDIVATYDARFARMWEFYLAACEKEFALGPSHVVQLQLGRERDAVPLHRDYVGPACAALAAREDGAVARIAAATEAAFAAEAGRSARSRRAAG